MQGTASSHESRFQKMYAIVVHLIFPYQPSKSTSIRNHISLYRDQTIFPQSSHFEQNLRTESVFRTRIGLGSMKTSVKRVWHDE